MRTHGRTPGRPAGLTAHSISQTSVTLAIVAPGSDGSRAPAARAYVIKQSRRAIRSRREFQRAPALCDGSCRFDVTVVGTRIDLTITGLRPGSTYHYAVAARDNVSNKLGPRSRTIRVRTR